MAIVTIMTHLGMLSSLVPPNPQRYSSLIGFARQEKKRNQITSVIESNGRTDIYPRVTSDYSIFVYPIRSPVTREYYLRRLRRFFDFLGLKEDAP